jgi:hypothetical protein
MSKIPTLRIYNSDNTFIDRPMNEVELEQYEKDKAEAAVKIIEDTKKAADKTALLEKLGITADEAKLLLS